MPVLYFAATNCNVIERKKEISLEVWLRVYCMFRHHVNYTVLVDELASAFDKL